MASLLSANQAFKKLGVSSRILQHWHAQGCITAEHTYSEVCLYDINHVLSRLTLTSSTFVTLTEWPSKYIYIQASSPKQQSNLKQQKQQYLQQLYPSHLVLTDITSGINWKRSGLKTLLECSSHGLVTKVGFAILFSIHAKAYQNFPYSAQIVVAHRDQLCHFTFDLIKHVFHLNGTKIIVVHSSDNTSSSVSAANELTQDILTINTVFICCMQGWHSAENLEQRRTNNKQDGGKKYKVGEILKRNGIDEELEGVDLPENEAGLDEGLDGVC